MVVEDLPVTYPEKDVKSVRLNILNGRCSQCFSREKLPVFLKSFDLVQKTEGNHCYRKIFQGKLLVTLLYFIPGVRANDLMLLKSDQIHCYYDRISLMLPDQKKRIIHLRLENGQPDPLLQSTNDHLRIMSSLPFSRSVYLFSNLISPYKRTLDSGQLHADLTRKFRYYLSVWIENYNRRNGY